LSKKLEDLSAAKAGVSQAELEEAFLSLGTLEQENAEQEGLLEAATAAKEKARTALNKANDNMRAVLSVRDPIQEELQRASWIVRNADPDQPVPPLGNQAPRIKSVRS